MNALRAFKALAGLWEFERRLFEEERIPWTPIDLLFTWFRLRSPGFESRLITFRHRGEVAGKVLAIAGGRGTGFLDGFYYRRHRDAGWRLLDEGLRQLRALGARKAYVSYTGFPAVAVSGSPRLPLVMTPHNPLHYVDMFESFGFKKSIAHVENCAKISGELGPGRPNPDASPGLKIRPATPPELGPGPRALPKLVHETFMGEGLQVPLSLAETSWLIKAVATLGGGCQILVAELGGEIAGFAIGVPDINYALHRVKSPADLWRLAQLPSYLRRPARCRSIVGVREKFRGRGLGTLLTFSLIEGLRARGCVEVGGVVARENLEAQAVQAKFSPEVTRQLQTYEIDVEAR